MRVQMLDRGQAEQGSAASEVAVVEQLEHSVTHSFFLL